MYFLTHGPSPLERSHVSNIKTRRTFKRLPSNVFGLRHDRLQPRSERVSTFCNLV